MTLLRTYRRLGSAARVDAERARSIVAAAMPHAMAALGRSRGARLPVRAERVSDEVARGGGLIPAWPVRQPDGSVVIEHVANWGTLLTGWLTCVGEQQRGLAQDLVDSGQRIWIGIANDVLQLFATDPPADTYSMIRHHALMLAAATTWLGAEATRAWANVHASAGREFLRRHAGESLWIAVDAAEHGLTALLLDSRSRQPARLALGWLDTDADARARYIDYLAAASLGVVAVLDALQASGQPDEVWLAQAVADLHADPAFNRGWMEGWSSRASALPSAALAGAGGRSQSAETTARRCAGHAASSQRSTVDPKTSRR